MTIAEVYNKYHHLDRLFGDRDWGGDEFRRVILRDLWAAVKNAHSANDTARGALAELVKIAETPPGRVQLQDELSSAERSTAVEACDQFWRTLIVNMAMRNK